MQSDRGEAETERGGGGTPNHDDARQMSEDMEDQILLERDGKFCVVNTDDIMADDQPQTPPSSSPSSSDEAAAALHISSMSLKMTTSGGPRGRGTFSQRSGGTRPPAAPRSKSAVALAGARRQSTDYSSTHRLTDEQKRQVQY